MEETGIKTDKLQKKKKKGHSGDGRGTSRFGGN